MKSSIYILVILVFCFFTCGNGTNSNSLENNLSQKSLDPIWYEGKAEISSYELLQNRYNGIHEGEAVLIFVTEPFLSDKQVKNDSGRSENSVSVLKNNQIRRFTTGIYDYSIFTSTFTDATQLNTYKVTNSSQDWCGQSYSQLNQIKGGYRFELRSYFESEGDQQTEIKDGILEDALFNLLRIDPKQLPIGEFKIIPASHVARLLHKPMKAIKAIGSLKSYENDDMNGNNLKVYSIEMPSLQRELEIIYDASTTTNEIVGWKDSSPSVFDNIVRTTTAKRKTLLWSPYWGLNSPSDTLERNNLQLKGFGH